MIEIVATGPLTTVQDLGRPGFAALGVPASGAFDRAALRLANRLVGNDEAAAGLEVTFGGLVVTLRRAATLALTGAACPGLDVGVAVTQPAGSTVRLGLPPVGLRSYLAVRGGLTPEPVLTSRSTDTLSGIGPAILRPGAVLPVGRPRGTVSGTSAPPRRGPTRAHVDPGPRADWFTGDALADLIARTWSVRADSDRIGIRLDGPAFTRRAGGELLSEATLPGAVQVPPDGRPIVFGPDGPVTGGYPVIAVVRDLDVLAQARPGSELRFG